MKNATGSIVFIKNDILTLSSIIGWKCATERNRYKCLPVTATWIVLLRRSYPCRWKYLEVQFDMHSSKLSEVFYECFSSIVDKYGHLVTSFFLPN